MSLTWEIPGSFHHVLWVEPYSYLLFSSAVQVQTFLWVFLFVASSSIQSYPCLPVCPAYSPQDTWSEILHVCCALRAGGLLRGNTRKVVFQSLLLSSVSSRIPSHCPWWWWCCVSVWWGIVNSVTPAVVVGCDCPVSPTGVPFAEDACQLLVFGGMAALPCQPVIMQMAWTLTPLVQVVIERKWWVLLPTVESRHGTRELASHLAAFLHCFICCVQPCGRKSPEAWLPKN